MNVVHMLLALVSFSSSHLGQIRSMHSHSMLTLHSNIGFCLDEAAVSKRVRESRYMPGANAQVHFTIAYVMIYDLARIMLHCTGQCSGIVLNSLTRAHSFHSFPHPRI
jgi:hypothetical protein